MDTWVWITIGALIIFILFHKEILSHFIKDSLSYKRLYPVKRKSSNIDLSNAYYLTSLLTKAEAAFYSLLKHKCDLCELSVCPKVRLEDFINVRNIREKQSYRGRIKSRHVDFLICDRYLNPLCGIELDDNSHNTQKAKAADEFKNALYDAVNLPLYRVRTGTNFETQIEKIVNEIQGEKNENT